VAARSAVAAPSPSTPEATRPRPRPLDLRVSRREADFLPGETEVALRVSFDGYTPGPFSLFTSFLGWTGVGIDVHHGVATVKDFTFTVGGEAHASQAALLAALSQSVANYDDLQFRWSMFETGATARTTAHWTRLRGVDPWVGAGVGGGYYQLDARVEGWPGTTAGRSTSPWVRVELLGGANWRLGAQGRFVLGPELHYQVTFQTSPDRQLALRHEGDEAIFSLFPQHKPSRGFGWTMRAGVRF
jgi:opacity protein-like surface antigen